MAQHMHKCGDCGEFYECEFSGTHPRIMTYLCDDCAFGPDEYWDDIDGDDIDDDEEDEEL